MTRKITTVVVFCFCAMMATASMAAPVVSSLNDLGAYGTWVSEGTNGKRTVDGTVTSADFELAEGFVAQYYVTEVKNIAKTGGNRIVPAGAIASVYDETAPEEVPEVPEAPKEITEYAAEDLASAEAVISLFGGTKGENGQVMTKVPAYTSFIVHDAWGLVNIPDSNDLNVILTVYAGEKVVTGPVALDATFWPDPNYGKEPEADPEIAVIPADSLITSTDVIATFGGTVGDNGEVVTEVPAYTRFEVYVSWIGVSRWDGTTAKSGETVETASDPKPVTFWPDPDWKADADKKAADTGNGGGGGGGGCDAGFGALAFALLPLFYFKKGRK